MRKILLICASSQTIITFRRRMILELQRRGYHVSVVAFDSLYKEDAEKLGVDFYSVNDGNRSINPFHIFSLQKKYENIISNISPDVVFTFMLKPNVFGIQAAKRCKIENIYAMVEGLGDVFINKSLKWNLIRGVVCKLYRRAFFNARKVFFLNQDDREEFVTRKLLRDDQCELIAGIGVDLEYFECKPIKNKGVFLMVARMLKTKGVLEFCECARCVKQIYPNAVFNYLGSEGNVRLADIQEYIDDGSVNYLGVTKDVRRFLEECTVFVLPSYREGMPMSIMEAEAVGRPIITTDNVGCRDTVKEGYNGFLIPPSDQDTMVQRCIYLIENHNEAERMGENSRMFAEKYFDAKIINDRILSVIDIATDKEASKLHT